MRRCSVASRRLYVMPPAVLRLRQHFFLDGLLQAGLLFATPFLSNTAIVAVACSRGRRLR